MELNREFFPSVRKTVMQRPYYEEQTDVLGQKGTAWATGATMYGDNWYIDHSQGLVEVYEAGAALSFYNILPKKNKYEKEGLYLNLKIAYRTTENANANIRTFSGNHVTLPNSVTGAIYEDPNCFWWVTDDMTVNINSIYSGEKLWIQRVDWEWMSKETIYEDQLDEGINPYLLRSTKDIEKLYLPSKINDQTIKEFLVNKINKDPHFAKRCLLLLKQDELINQKLIDIFESTDIKL
jgi:hypothetical protein